MIPLLFGGNAQALPIHVSDYVTLYNGAGTTAGGEFLVDVLGKWKYTSP